MIQPMVQDRQIELTDLCRRFHVKQLAVFGSAVTERFDPEQSDLDFLVEFEDVPLLKYADCYFGLLEGLESLFRRPIDLVELKAIHNPYFLRSVETSRVPLYAA